MFRSSDEKSIFLIERITKNKPKKPKISDHLIELTTSICSSDDSLSSDLLSITSLNEQACSFFDSYDLEEIPDISTSKQTQPFLYETNYNYIQSSQLQLQPQEQLSQPILPQKTTCEIGINTDISQAQGFESLAQIYLSSN